MDDDAPPCGTPLPSDAQGWAIEVAAAAEMVDDPQPLRLADGSVLEPDDARDAVVLAMVATRGLDCSSEDVAELVEAVAELDAGLDDDEDLVTITIRYLACHSALELIDEPSTEWVAQLVSETRKLIEK